MSQSISCYMGVNVTQTAGIDKEMTWEPQTETSSLLAPNVAVTRKRSSSQVSLLKKPADSATPLSRAT